MTILIAILHILVCVLLILVILLQAGRGAGLSWGTFGGNPQSLFGTKSATFLSKATSISAIIFLLTCIALNVIETKKAKSLFSNPSQTKIDIEKIKQALDKIKEEEKTPAPDAAAENPAPSADKPEQPTQAEAAKN